jgi:hypothetical protein
MDNPRRKRGGARVPSLDKVVAYTAIIAAVCAPPMLFFAAAAFFQWTPSTFTGLGVLNKPVGIAIIALILGVCPWAVLSYVYSRNPRGQPPSSPMVTVAPPSTTNSNLRYRSITGIELLKFMESAKLASVADAFFTPTAVKILCSDKGRDLAEQLVRALILLNFEVVVNHDNASHLFPARPDQANGITLRSQPGNRVMMMVDTGLSGAHLNCTKVEFPKGDEYNYTQIEIGDPRVDSYWDSRL